MPEQNQIDAEANQSDLAARVAVLEDTIATLRRNLLEPAMTRPGSLRYGGNVMDLGRLGAQIVMPGGGTAKGAMYFVKEFFVSEDANGRYKGNPQIELTGAYTAGTSVQFADSTYMTRDNSLSGPVASVYRTVISGTSAEVMLLADYNQDGNAAELRVKEDSSGNLTYQVHRGSGVYDDIGSGGAWIAFPI